MFLFRIIALPFVMLGSLLGLFGLTTRVFLLPLRFVARNPILALALLIAVILYFSVKSDPNSLNQLKPAPTDKQAKNLPKGAIPVIESVSKFEDGNSAFATDVYKTMTDDERAQYSRVFYAVMARVPNGQTHIWNYYNIHGSLTPTSTFKNNYGETCRKFTEVLKVHKVQQTISGTACDNGGGSWCKLKINATPACGLGGKPAGLLDGITKPLSDLF